MSFKETSTAACASHPPEQMAAEWPKSASSADALHRMALSEAVSGHYCEAESLLEQAIADAPDRARWYCDLGIVRIAQSRWVDAISVLEKAVELDHSIARIWRTLARACAGGGRAEAAGAALLQSLELDPYSKSGHLMMAGSCREAGHRHLARRHQAEAHRADSHDAEVIAQLALDCWFDDDVFAAIEYGSKLINAGQATPEFHSVYLYWLLFDPARSAVETRASHEQWASAHCGGVTKLTTETEPDAERPIRLGYLSAEFVGGPPVFFLPPLIAGHDRTQFEVFLYNRSARQDAHTEWFRQHADHFRSCDGMSVEAVAEAIRRDRIDILIDPSGYSREHGMHVCALRPAPIQVNYPLYPSTRGLREIDYVFTDRWLTPEGSETEYCEKPIRLPSGSIAYVPPEDAPDAGPLPRVRNGFVTYGLFQRRVKLNDAVLDAVAAVLTRSPESKLLIQHLDPDLDRAGSESRASLIREFLIRDVSEARIRFAGPRTRRDLMSVMGETDIALDSFPFAGHTTTCECLWMGVPVVTLAGSTHAGRTGVSILNSVGLPKWVALTRDEYVSKAVDFAADMQSLEKLRRGLRERLRQTGFVDSRRLAKEFDKALREIWRDWCRQQASK